jgi:anti-sigma factor RsiW
MTCSEFLEGFSEFYDAVGSSPVRRRAEEHIATCPRCRRYVEIVDRGRDLLRSSPPVPVSGDFRDRLRHRLYHVDDGEALSRIGSASGTTAMTALGMAIVLVFAAWAPTLLSLRPEVELTPIVVSRPEPRTLGLRIPPISLFPVGSSALADERDLRRRANDLLLRHSLLNDPGRWSLLQRHDFE